MLTLRTSLRTFYKYENRSETMITKTTEERFEYYAHKGTSKAQGISPDLLGLRVLDYLASGLFNLLDLAESFPTACRMPSDSIGKLVL